MAKAIPDGYHSVTPYLVCKGAAAAIDFYKRAFGAVELMRMEGPDGSIGHAEVKIGDSPIMLADEHPAMNYLSPASIGGSPVGLMIYTDDCDAAIADLRAGGVTITAEPADQPWGERVARVLDFDGNEVIIATAAPKD